MKDLRSLSQTNWGLVKMGLEKEPQDPFLGQTSI